MAFRFSRRSLDNLATVQPSLRILATRALQLSPIDFTVIQGRRTWDEQARLYGKGRSVTEMRARGLPIEYADPRADKVTWTMNSNHMSGRAIDFAPWLPGRGIVLPPRPTPADIELFYRISTAFKQAAMEQCVVIEWGGDWSSTKDYPHIEMAH